MIQYQPLVGPLTTAQPPEDKGWNRVQPDNPVRRPWSAALTVVACVVPLTTAQPYETYGWQRQQPDPIRPVGIHASLIASGETRNPITGLVDLRSDVGGSSTAVGSVPILQYQALAAPIFVSAPDSSIAIRIPTTPPHVKRLHVSQFPSWFSDKFSAPTPAVVTALSWRPQYPDAIAPRRGLATMLQRPVVADTLTVPTTAPSAPDGSWQPSYPARHPAPASRATYVWGQQHFGFVDLVPVMSWTGWYLDPPVLRRSPRAILLGGSVWPIGISGTPPPTELVWQGRAPAQLWAKPWSLAAIDAKASAPVVVADITVVVPDSSWAPSYPAQHWPARVLRVDLQRHVTADTVTAPAVVVAPDLSAAVYPAQVYGRPPLVPQRWWIAPLYVADVTVAAPSRSWAPTYPDRVVRLTIPSAQQRAETAPIFIPGITVIPPAHSWNTTYPDRIPALRIWRAADAPAVFMDANFLATIPADPTHAIVSDGTVLVFRLSDGTVLLYRVDDGIARWR